MVLSRTQFSTSAQRAKQQPRLKQSPILVTVFAALLASHLVGCGKKDESNTQVPQADTAGASHLASVNGRAVSTEAFDAFLQHKRITPRNDAHRKTLLENYLEREALADVIQNEGGLDRAAIEAEINELKKEIVISRYFDSFLDKSVSDGDIKAYYDANAEKYSQKKVRVSHILIRTSRNMSEQDRQVRLTVAREAWSKLGMGKPFADIVAEYSEDKISAKKAGDLGWMKQGAISPQFSEKAFSTEVNAYTEPFETPFGYHIVKVTEAPAVVKQSFESARGKIRHILRSQAKQRESERLRNKVKVEVAS